MKIRIEKYLIPSPVYAAAAELQVEHVMSQVLRATPGRGQEHNVSLVQSDLKPSC